MLLTNCLCLLAFGAACPSAWADTNALTLERAVRLALENNPSLLASRARVAAAAGREVQARARENPELELSAEGMPVRGGGFSQSKKLVGVLQPFACPFAMSA